MRRGGIALAGLLGCAGVLHGQGLATRADRTRFEETSRWSDVSAAVEALAREGGTARALTFGYSEEARALPLVVLSKPAVGSPSEARRLNRPVVLVLANIHGGEVEGKEASLRLAGRLAGGDLAALTDRIIVLIAPIYNADGNERVSATHRPEQNGPIAGVGRRENARGLDLNRDFVKAEAAETRALLGVLTAWDPAVVIDLHTTNGSFHGYHLTWAPSLGPNTDSRITGFARHALLPSVAHDMDARGWRTFSYGNFTTVEALSREFEGEGPEAGTRAWRTFDDRPRFGTNYVGLRNRIAVLSEAYSYLSFERRIAVTEAFTARLLTEVAARAEDVHRLVLDADREVVGLAARGALAPLAVESRVTQSSPSPSPVLVGEVDHVSNPLSGRSMTVMREDRTTPVPMRIFDAFEASRTIRPPLAYALDAGRVGAGTLSRVAALLRLHGIAVESLGRPRNVLAEQVVVTEVQVAPRAFQGHRTVRITGQSEPVRTTLPRGSLFVTLAQPLARLVFQLLAPEPDDGMVTWNLLDEGLAVGTPAPVVRVRSAR